MLVTLFLVSCHGEPTEHRIERQGKATARFLQEEIPTPAVGTVGGAWLIIGLKKNEAEVEEEYYQYYYDDVRARAKSTKGVLTQSYYTDYARVAMGVETLGENPQDVEGYDLLEPLNEGQQVLSQGLTGPIFALIASNYCGVPLEREQEYLDYIVNQTTIRLDQPGDSGDALSEQADYLAMAIQALSYYRDREEVNRVIESCLERLSREQKKDGGYETLETTAQVILALNSMNISVEEDSRFIKQENTLEDGLFLFRQGEGFAHKRGEEVNLMASEQGLLALASLKLQEEGKYLYEHP